MSRGQLLLGYDAGSDHVTLTRQGRALVLEVRIGEGKGGGARVVLPRSAALVRELVVALQIEALALAEEARS